MTTTTDTAALAANDDTHVKTVGEHIEDAAANVQEQPGTSGEIAPTTGEIAPEAAAAPADAVPVNPEPPPEIPSQREADLQARVNSLEERLRYFVNRREKEQHLLSQRDSALAAIEGAKARVQSEKQGLAEVEEEIAALLKEPVPMAFESTPIGQAIAEAKQEETAAPAAPEPPPVPAWESLLPSVQPDAVKLLDAAAGDELPTVDALCGALLAPQAMMGGKRVIKQAVQVYGTPWIVTHLWKDEATGACRANVVRLYTKDEYQQTHEAKYGRAVGDFDQSDEAKTQRQIGGEWCGLVVKVGRKVYVVGPQSDALHLAYCPPEPQQQDATVGEPWPVGSEIRHQTFGRGTVVSYDLPNRMVRFEFFDHGSKEMGLDFCASSISLLNGNAPADEASADDARREVQGDPDDWQEIAKRAKAIIEATGMDPAAYAHQYGLPVVALLKFLETGEPSLDKDTDAKLYDAFPPFDDEDEQEEDQHTGPGLPAQA